MGAREAHNKNMGGNVYRRPGFFLIIFLSMGLKTNKIFWGKVFSKYKRKTMKNMGWSSNRAQAN